MRILHILDHSIPLQSGYTFRTLSILTQQRALGWETMHLTSPKHARPFVPHETVDGWEFYRTPAPTWPSRIPVANEIAQIQATTNRLLEIVDKVRPDVLHTHSPVLNAIPALRVRSRRDIPVVYEVRAFWEDAAASHGTSQPGGLRYRATRALETYALRRAFGIVYLAYVTDHTVAVGADHIIYGWVFFAIVTLILIAIGAKFRDAHSPTVPPARSAGAPPSSRPIAAGAVVIALALLGVSYGATAYADYANDDGRVAAGEPLRLPDAPAGWSRFDHPVDTWQPGFKGASETRMATYVLNGKAVHLFIALFRHQTPDAKLVSAGNSVVGDDVWARAGSGASAATVDGKDLTVLATRMVKNGLGRLVWHWYWIDGRYTSNSYVAKALETKVKLFDLPRSAAVIAVAADYADSPGDAASVLDKFLRAVPDLSSGLRRAAGR
jgi:EpsI family protein